MSKKLLLPLLMIAGLNCLHASEEPKEMPQSFVPSLKYLVGEYIAKNYKEIIPNPEKLNQIIGPDLVEWIKFFINNNSYNYLEKMSHLLERANFFFVWALRRGYLPLIQNLTDRGFNIFNELTQLRNGMSSLMIAAEFGQPAVIDFLYEKGAQINEKNQRIDLGHPTLTTPLYYACGNCPKSIIQTVSLLLLLGADVNAQTSNGITPLHKLIMSGSLYNHKEPLEAMKLLLLNNDINIDIQDSIAGDTPLIKAARNGLSKVVQLLLEQNANCMLTNNEGDSALDVAQHRKASWAKPDQIAKYDKIIQLLTEAMQRQEQAQLEEQI